MRVSRIVECVAGIGTATLAIFLYVYGEIRYLEFYRQDPEIQSNISGQLFFLFLIAVPGVLIVIGACAHAIKRRVWGYWLLNGAAAVNNFLIVALFVGIVWSYPAWAVLLFIIQFFLVLVAVAAACFQQMQFNKLLQRTRNEVVSLRFHADSTPLHLQSLLIKQCVF
jgi:hypothetical protein